MKSGTGKRKTVAPRSPNKNVRSIEVLVHDGQWRQSLPRASLLVRRACLAALDHASVADAQVCIVLSDDARIRELNHDWRGKDKPTNVLSFPSGEKPALGDIVLARETILREAAAQGKPAKDHVAHLAVHGCLHLLGYDHEHDGEAAIMEKMEINILNTLGISNPYLSGAAKPTMVQ
jgi:probable rRNA maturation factor